MKVVRILAALILSAAFTAAQASSCTKAAVDKDTNLPLYICISADTKPTGTTVPPGSTAYETDTKKTYHTNAAGAWVEAPIPVTLQDPLACERNIGSVTAGVCIVKNEVTPTVLDGTSAVTIGGGAASDTYLCGLFIPGNGGGAITAAVTGMADQLGAAKTFTVTGTTTVDTNWNPNGCMVNTAGALTVTPSVDDKVVVLWKARQ